MSDNRFVKTYSQGVVDVVEVERSLEVRAARAGEEVEASVMAEDVVALLHDRWNRSHHYNLIVAGAAGKFPQCLHRILDSAGVHIVKLDAL